MDFDENILSLTDEQAARVRELIQEVRQAPQADFFDRELTGELYIPVDGGEIRCFHHAPANPEGARPVLFISGWGTIPEGFSDFFNAVAGRIECFYLETREKNSSRIQRSGTDFSMDQQARDIQKAVQHLGLADRDFVMIGTCWGSTMIAHGLARGIIDSATVWKWKQTALRARDENLYDLVGSIQQEVFVINGVQDRIHDNARYPQLAALMPKGRLFLYAGRRKPAGGPDGNGRGAVRQSKGRRRTACCFQRIREKNQIIIRTEKKL